MTSLQHTPLIFLSYRQADTKDIANRIATKLKEIYNPQFGENAVFIDTDIQGGDEWAEVVRQKANDAKLILVIIGSKWASIKNDAGERRLFKQDDWVQSEVRMGIDNKSVIPVLIDTTLPAKNELPKALHSLLKFQAIPMSTKEGFEESMTTLVNTINTRLAKEGLLPETHNVIFCNNSSRRFWINFILVFAAIIPLIVLVYLFTTRTEESLALLAFAVPVIGLMYLILSQKFGKETLDKTWLSFFDTHLMTVFLGICVVVLIVSAIVLETDRRASTTTTVLVDDVVVATSTQPITPSADTADEGGIQVQQTEEVSTTLPGNDETPSNAGVPVINQDADDEDEVGLSVTRFVEEEIFVATSDTSAFSVGQRMVISTAETTPRPSHICRIATITENAQFTCRPELQNEDIPLGIEVGNPVSPDLDAVELLRFVPVVEDVIGFVVNLPDIGAIIRLRQNVSVMSGDVLVRIAFSISTGTPLYLPDDSTSLVIDSVSEIGDFPIARFTVNTLGENITLEDGMLVRLSVCPSQSATLEMIEMPAREYMVNDSSTVFGDAATYTLETTFALSRYEISGDQFAVFLNELQTTIADGVACGNTTITALQTHFTESDITTLALESNRRSTLPMGGLSAQQAQLFCQWYGLDLPTAQQWEIAASCPIAGINPGGNCTLYPWGNDRLWNGQASPSEIFNISQTECNGLNCLQPVLDGQTSQNGFVHMTGNVSEWVLSNETYGGNVCTDDMNALMTFNPTQENTETCGSENSSVSPNPIELIGFRCVDTNTQN